MSRRGDWSVIPLASAELAEQELAQGNLKEDQIQAKEESIIGFYLQAINLGQRHAAVVRRVVQLLFKNGRGSNALELLSSIPVESQLAVILDVKQLGLPLKIETSSTQSKSPERQSRPNPMISRSESGWFKFSWPVSVRPRPRKNFARQSIFLRVIPIDGSALVIFMIVTKQPEEAEKIIHEAETKLPPSRAPMALALCCEKMGQMYGGSGNATEMKKWNDAATKWYKKAESAQPEDLSIKRRLTEFLLRSKQINEAKSYLESIRKQDACRQEC